MSERTRVALLFGGRSVEHEVSVDSARGVAGAMEQGGLECVPIGVTGDGEWLSPRESRSVLDGDTDRVSAPAGEMDRVVVRPGAGLALVTADGSCRSIDVDVVFPLVHGWGGEDGRVQGALELAGVPYVGAGVLGSSTAMDKVVAKQLFERNGLAVVPGLSVRSAEYRSDAASIEERIASEVGFPLFVKPANGGSSVGVSRVADTAGLRAALEQGFDHDLKVVVEQAIDAREIECAVLGNHDPEASGLGEIEPSREFYDYAAKYVDGTSKLHIPAALDAKTTALVRESAIAAYRALDLCGLARIDFLVDRRDGRIFVNEANTLPGFTPISMFSKLWEASGLPFPGLVVKLVELAMTRAEELRGMANRHKTD